MLDKFICHKGKHTSYLMGHSDKRYDLVVEVQTKSPLPYIMIRRRGATKNWKVYHYSGATKVDKFKKCVVIKDDPTQAMLKAIEIVKDFYARQLQLLETLNV